MSGQCQARLCTRVKVRQLACKTSGTLCIPPVLHTQNDQLVKEGERERSTGQIRGKDHVRKHRMRSGSVLSAHKHMLYTYLVTNRLERVGSSYAAA